MARALKGGTQHRPVRHRDLRARGCGELDGEVERGVHAKVELYNVPEFMQLVFYSDWYWIALNMSDSKVTELFMKL